jgi:uncharacterized repeat protein (TIGR04052 family)
MTQTKVVLSLSCQACQACQVGSVRAGRLSGPTSALFFGVLLGLGAATGCGDDEDAKPVATAIPFAFELGGQPFSCGAAYAGLGASAASYTVTDARFFLHSVELVDEDGRGHPLELDAGPFQGQGVALLDFENGCGDDGTAELHTELTGTAPDRDYRGLRFTLGVPTEQNFVDLTTAAAPLDVTGMFWIWQFGYKFLKVDGMARGTAAASPFFVHLGSNGCPGTNVGAPPTGPCTAPHQVEVALNGWDAGETVVADLAPVLATTDLTTNMPGTAPGCMSDPVDRECASILPKLGVGAAQVFFQVR